MKKNIEHFLILILLISSFIGKGQTTNKSTSEEVKIWYHKDLKENSIPGISTDKAYEFLKEKKSETVIVAIIDTSIDIMHEDLQGKIWVNGDEIENNGIDDDDNGYIDDVNGWNFIGDLTFQNYEYERMLMEPDLVENKTVLKEIKKKYNNKLKEAQTNIKESKKSLTSYSERHHLFSNFLEKEDYTLEEVFNVKSDDTQLNQKIEQTKKWVSKRNKHALYFGATTLALDTKNVLLNIIDQQKKNISEDSLCLTGQTIKINYRATLGDDIENINDRDYGNNKPNQFLDEDHNTHIAGIIAANRNNNIGIKGISNDCLIMPIRVNGSGDEYDKDVALAIRYAVDNGAKVINASFGKHYSLHKEWVFDAIKYAEKSDALIITSAGNDNLNIDTYFTYPSDTKDLKNEFSNNVVVVGASTYDNSIGIAAKFSNYGKNNVDIFAPGKKIYSSLPNNKYDYKEGTSMATPMVAGVAALILSYYPNLTAQEVKQVILESGTTIDFEVSLPGNSKKKVPFSDLCSSSSILNAYNAVKMAEQVSLNK